MNTSTRTPSKMKYEETWSRARSSTITPNQKHMQWNMQELQMWRQKNIRCKNVNKHNGQITNDRHIQNEKQEQDIRTGLYQQKQKLDTQAIWTGNSTYGHQLCEITQNYNHICNNIHKHANSDHEATTDEQTTNETKPQTTIYYKDN